MNELVPKQRKSKTKSSNSSRQQQQQKHVLECCLPMRVCVFCVCEIVCVRAGECIKYCLTQANNHVKFSKVHTKRRTNSRKHVKIVKKTLPDAVKVQPQPGTNNNGKNEQENSSKRERVKSQFYTTASSALFALRLHCVFCFYF